MKQNYSYVNVGRVGQAVHTMAHMAYTIRKYTTKKGVFYEVRYRTPDGRSTGKRGFARKMDADAWGAEHVTSAKAAGTYIRPAAGRTTIGDLWPAWIAAKQVRSKPSYIESLEGAWRKHVEPAWGARQIGSIRHAEVQEWVTAMSAQYSASVVLRAAGVLRSLLKTAVADRLIAVNPADGLTMPRKSVKRHIYLAVDELTRLADECAWRHDMILTLGATGLRWGEMVALRVGDVDLARRRIRVERSSTEVGGRIVTTLPKTYERRGITYPKMLEQYLRARMAGRDEEAPLFTQPDGSMVRRRHGPTSPGTWFYAAKLRALGEHVARSMTFHDLRHTAASLMVSAGANVKAVQRQLGHKSAAMTLDVYADLFDDDLDAVAERLDLLFSERGQNVGTEQGTLTENVEVPTF